MKSSFVNLLKGLAIFLMLWGHCIQVCAPVGYDFFDNAVFEFIYSFHMPLFMLISGYLFYFSAAKRELKELLKNRCVGLVQTIIVCGILSYFATTGLFAVISGNFSALIGGKWLSSLSGLWFLWSVLAASIVLGVVCKVTNKFWLQIILLVIGVVVVGLFPNAVLNIFVYPYYIIGFYFAKYKDTVFKKIAYAKYIALVAFPVLLLFYEKRHYIYTTGLFGKDYTILQCLEIDVFRWLIGLVGSIFVIVVMEMLYNLNIKARFFVWLQEAICKCGEKSLQIYVLSCVLLSCYLPAIYSKAIGLFPQIDVFFADNIWIYNLGLTLILGILYTFAIYFVQIGLEKIKLSKFLFGR